MISDQNWSEISASGRVACTVRDILSNRFYIGNIQDGDGGWLKAKHEPFIDSDEFEKVQRLRAGRRRLPFTVNINARTYSLSCLARCNRCGKRIRIHSDKKGRPRVYCFSKIQGFRCDFQGTFLNRYELQIESYLRNFIIPENFKEQILQNQAKLEEAYDNQGTEKKRLEANLNRLKQQFRWGHIEEAEYLSEYRSIENQLERLNPIGCKSKILEELARFLTAVNIAWKEANQSERNRIARVLFDDILLDSKGIVVALKPRIELEPFFRLSFEAHKKNLGSDPEGI